MWFGNQQTKKQVSCLHLAFPLTASHTHTHTHTVSRGRISTTQHPSQEKNAKCRAGSNHSNCEIQPDGRWKSGCLARDSALPCPARPPQLPSRSRALLPLCCGAWFRVGIGKCPPRSLPLSCSLQLPLVNVQRPEMVLSPKSQHLFYFSSGFWLN